jgi:hypothetical protein
MDGRGPARLPVPSGLRSRSQRSSSRRPSRTAAARRRTSRRPPRRCPCPGYQAWAPATRTAPARVPTRGRLEIWRRARAAQVHPRRTGGCSTSPGPAVMPDQPGMVAVGARLACGVADLSMLSPLYDREAGPRLRGIGHRAVPYVHDRRPARRLQVVGWPMALTPVARTAAAPSSTSPSTRATIVIPPRVASAGVPDPTSLGRRGQPTRLPNTSLTSRVPRHETGA